ncbi:MAG: cyclic nucleotide-binding domain-containing protein [Nitrospira sp.]|nr:cyclic nucleotide-binding domain-containing protein [Nitrospira sp.]
MPTAELIQRTKQSRAVKSGRTPQAMATVSRCEPPSPCAPVSLAHNGQRTLDQGQGRTLVTYPRKHTIFSQGERAHAVYYIREGKVKLTVVSPQGKEAVVAILDRGAFVGESCLAGQQVQLATATTLEDSSLVRIDKDAMIHLLREESAFAEFFMAYLLTHAMRVQEDLVDHLFNNSEKRLARVLLLLARFGTEGKPEPVIAKINQETLAEMVGTTRSRVSFFMNKFRKLGYIEYSSDLHVHSSLLNVLLHD